MFHQRDNHLQNIIAESTQMDEDNNALDGLLTAIAMEVQPSSTKQVEIEPTDFAKFAAHYGMLPSSLNTNRICCAR